MFAIEQIKAAHSKVKSGADFPKYIADLKELGVTAYEHYVADGHIQYFSKDHFTLLADAKWIPRMIAEVSSIDELGNSLTIHQQGQTDYLTFCKQAAEAGVEKWKVNIIAMSCIYYDRAGNQMLAEAIPTV